MSGIKIGMTLGICFFALTAVAMAPTRKPGLWDMTTTMTWQQAPVAGMPAAMPAHTQPVCLTQAMIDKFGAIAPSTQAGCEVKNVVIKSNSMSADLVCTGRMTGKGSVESAWTDDEHATSSVHFTGSMAAGPQGTKTIEWTSHSTSVFKGTGLWVGEPTVCAELRA